MPITRRAELKFDDETHPVYPIGPASVRLNTTPKEGISGKLTYVGEARADELPARTLQGQIAVMEITGRDNWQRAYNAGAAAVILLGNGAETYLDIQNHFLPLPINVPRFYVTAGELADRLRKSELTGRQPVATLRVDAAWQEAEATNFYALVQPEEKSERPAIAVIAPVDAMGVAHDLAQGADAGVDLVFALSALRHFSANRPKRPILFAFIDAYSINQLGLRKMLTGIHLTPFEQRKIRKKDNGLLEKYKAITAVLDRLGEDDGVLDRLYEHEFKELHQAVKDEVARQVVEIETVMHPLRLAIFLAKDEEQKKVQQAEIDVLSARRAKCFASQVQMLTKEPVRDESRELCLEQWKRAAHRIRSQTDRMQFVKDGYEARDAMQREMLEALGVPLRDKGGNENSPIRFMFGIDLSDASVAAGPISYCSHWYTAESKNFSSFRNWLVARQKAASESGSPLWKPALQKAVNLNSLIGLDSGASYAVGQLPSMTTISRSFGIEGMTWATLDGLRTKVDTPNDTFAKLDWGRLNPQIEATFRLLQELAASEDFTPKKVTPKWNRVGGVVVDRSPGQPVPKLPMHGYLTTLIHGGAGAGKAGIRYLAPSPGLRRQEFVFTGIAGRFMFEAMPAQVDSYSVARIFAQSYLLRDDGEILRSVDLKKTGKGISVYADLRWATEPELKALMFTCKHIQALELFDPRFLADLPGATILDSRRGSEPQRMNFSLFRGIMSCQLEHGLRWQLILRAGIAKNRMALIRMAAQDETSNFSIRNSMLGFAVEERLPLHPVHMSARDFTRLDERRLGDYAKAGITSKAIQNLRKDTFRLLEEAEAALRNDDGGELLRKASAAMSNEVRAYQAVRDTANDVIRGAIVLLLLLVPFAFAVERLLFASPFVYKQLLSMTGIFSLMCAVLWSFHPAFRISSQPMIIIMSFAIIFMSLLVLSVIFSKFESGLEEMRSGLAESAAASTSRYGLMVTAIQLGIANMRKRKFRTALTGITIMLITFALLCFMSASSYSGHREYSLPFKAGFQGVLIRQPSMRQLPGRTLQYVDNAYEKGKPASRYWWAETLDPQWKIHIRNAETGKEVSLDAGLGLTSEEGNLTRVSELLPDWTAFADGNGCYLSTEIAERLGAKAGDSVLVGGQSLKLLGAFDSAKFDRRVVDLDGQRITPYDYSALDEDQRRQLLNPRLDQAAMEMESGAGMEPEVDLPRLSSNSVVIVPAAKFWGLSNFTLRNMAFAASDSKMARELAYQFANLLAFPIYYASGEEVRVLATTPLLPKAKKSIIIPLIIGGLIIFNTMLSSLAERKREIYIYTSLGLAPLHIGFLFLAEAITYGLLGSIFGYIVGQGLATVFTSLGWMGNLTLNYSGTQAIMTMLLVIVVVVLSSIVPAFLAGKLAVPSNEMSWSVPEPDGDTMRDTLPFTVTGQTADGVMAYLHEYMDAHSEGSIGNFSTDAIQTFRTSNNGHEHLGIQGTVWLAPYDLGVRQRIKLSIQPSDEDDIFEIATELKRESGQTRSWIKLNRVFLGDLRRQLLGWRNLRLDRMLEYIAKAGE